MTEEAEKGREEARTRIIGGQTKEEEGEREGGEVKRVQIEGRRKNGKENEERKKIEKRGGDSTKKEQPVHPCRY